MNASRLKRCELLIKRLRLAMEEEVGTGGTCGICTMHGHSPDECPINPLNIIDRLSMLEMVYRSNIEEMKDWRFTTEV